MSSCGTLGRSLFYVIGLLIAWTFFKLASEDTWTSRSVRRRSLTGLSEDADASTYLQPHGIRSEYLYGNSSIVTNNTYVGDPTKHGASSNLRIAREGQTGKSREQEMEGTRTSEKAATPTKAIHTVRSDEYGRGDTIAVCTWLKNEARHIVEWLVFHLELGVSWFRLYDDFSDDELDSKLVPFIRSGVVTLHRNYSGSQMDALRHCVQEIQREWALSPPGRRAYRWVLLLDIDEFMFPATRQYDRLPEALAEVGGNTAIACPSRHGFGSQGRSRTEGFVLESFIYRAAFPPSPPSAANNFSTGYMWYPKLVMNLEKLPNEFVSESKQGVRLISMHEASVPCPADWKISNSVVRVNHYLRSLQDFQLKLNMTTRYTSGKTLSMQHFWQRDHNDVRDTDVWRWRFRVRQALTTGIWTNSTDKLSDPSIFRSDNRSSSTALGLHSSEGDDGVGVEPLLSSDRDESKKCIPIAINNTVQDRCFPDFMVIGVSKAGSTSLFHLLNQHPSVRPPRVYCCESEQHFFDLRYEEGIESYLQDFPPLSAPHLNDSVGQKRQISGDVTPHYMYVPSVPRRIFETLPNWREVKFIVILRDPSARAYSNYKDKVRHGHEDRPFESVVKEQIASRKAMETCLRCLEDNTNCTDGTSSNRGGVLNRPRTKQTSVARRMLYPGSSSNELSVNAMQRELREQECFYPELVDPHMLLKHYVDKGIYVDQLERWMEIFPRRNFLILKMEAMFAAPVKHMNKITSFLGIDPFPASITGFPKANAAPLDEIMSGKDEKTLRWLKEFYKSYDQKLSEFIGTRDMF